VLTLGEILKLVNEYIGVSSGYLGDFTYRSHQEFYPQFCDVEVDVNDYEGTTRERFIKILQSSNNEAKAKIIAGVLKKYPLGSEPHRTQQLFSHFSSLANNLRGVSPIPNPDLATASEVLKRVLADAETLIRQSGATSAVDRIHTALHSYLIAVCDKSGIAHDTDPSLTRLFKSLRKEHPTLIEVENGSEEIGRVLQACATIMDALNPLRNRLSVAHPNNQLLGDAEAMLVVNVTRTLLHYFDTKFS
jgi:predicted RNA-binding protein Jag